MHEAGPAGWVVYVRAACHLCDQFLLELSLDLGPTMESVAIVDVDGDVEHAARFGLRVPVLEASGRVLCEGVYDGARVRAALGV
jgi:hypothetical protein